MIGLDELVDAVVRRVDDSRVTIEIAAGTATVRFVMLGESQTIHAPDLRTALTWTLDWMIP